MKIYFKSASLMMVMMVLLLFASIAAAAEFQADVVDSREVVTRKGHIWFKDGIYRLQMEPTSGPDQYLLVNTRNATTQVVFPKYKVYMEVPNDDFMSLMTNPFEAAEENTKSYKLKSEGREFMQGLDCERQLFQTQGQDAMRRWMAPELGFPVKIDLLLQNDWYTLLKNIKQTRVKDSDLKIPAAYTQKTEEEIKKLADSDPEITARAEAYKKNRPRKSDLAGFLSKGETWNLVFQPGIKIRLKAEAFDTNPSVSWFAVPYNGQKAAKSRDQCTYQGKGEVKIDPDLGVDGLALGVVTEGKVSFRITLIGRMPHLQAMRQVRYQKPVGGSSWQVKGDYQSCQVQFIALENTAASIRFKAAGKTHNLKIPAGESREFIFTPNDKLHDLDFTVDQGKVEVRYIQDNRSKPTPHVLLGMEKSAEATPVRDTDLYNACKEDKRAPWCYEEKVVDMRKPELCANITKHWGDNAGGVEGYCYYEIAKKTKDCSLCKKIKDSQIRNNLCIRDVCRK